EPILALRLRLNVVTIGMHVEAIGAFVDIGAAAWKQHIVAAVGILKNVHHRPLTRRRRPHEGAARRVEAVHCTGAAAMHELLVVVQVEAVEVDALATVNLFDAKNLAAKKFDGLAGAGPQYPFRNFFPLAHRLTSVAMPPGAFWSIAIACRFYGGRRRGLRH